MKRGLLPAREYRADNDCLGKFVLERGRHINILATLKTAKSNTKTIFSKKQMAEGVGFEPTVELPLLLISSQVPLTTQPPFHYVDSVD